MHYNIDKHDRDLRERRARQAFKRSGISAASIVNEQTGNLKLAQKFLGQLHDQDDRRHLHAHLCGSGTRRCNRSRTTKAKYCPEQEQLCDTELGEGIVTAQLVTINKKGA